MKHSASLLFSFILLVGDFLALVAAFTLAFIIRVKLDDRPLLKPLTAGGYIGVIAVLLVFWLIIHALLGLYRANVYENRFKEVFMLFVGSFIGILFLIGSEYVLNRAVFPARLVTVYGFLFAFMLTLLFRTLARAIRRTLFRFGVGVNNILIIGSTDITYELVERLSNTQLGYRVIGIVGNRRARYDHVSPEIQFKDFAQAAKKVSVRDIHSIVQTELFADQERNDEILTFAQEHHIGYRFVPGNSNLFVGSMEVNLFEGIPTIAVHQTALIGWGRLVKRFFDVIFSSIGLVLLSPIMLLTAIVVKLSDPKSSIFFKQTRLTRFNQEFTIYKFRSQYQKYDGTTPEEAFNLMGRPELIKEYRANGDALDHDPRITPLGAFLRASSLDELPQLMNVLRGDLSVVGPRPLIPQEMKLFSRHSIILSVKPGITGLATVSGRRDIPFEERRKLDMYYVQNWSFWLDIVILLRTIVMVLRRDGAR